MWIKGSSALRGGCGLGIAVLLATGARIDGQAISPVGMFEVYEENRREGISNLITGDFLILGYSMLLQNQVELIEARLAPDVFRFIATLQREIGKLPTSAAGVIEARQYLMVLRALSQGAPKVTGANASSAAASELALVLAARGIAPSPVTGQPTDYSQFVPRGRYTRTEEARRYFRTVRYAGAVLFPLRASRATATTAERADKLTAAALLMTRAVVASPDLSKTSERIDAASRWLFGQADNLSIADYKVAVDGLPPRATPLAAREALTQRYATRTPRLVGGIVDIGALDPGVSARDALLGWRLIPQRVTPDRIALQMLVYGGSAGTLRYKGQGQPRSLSVAGGAGPVKGFPLVDEVLALVGSEAAKARLVKTGETEYEEYDAAFAGAARAIEHRDGLAGDHLAFMQLLVQPAGDDAEVRLNTAAALWTFDKHREVLYAKQSYTGVGKGLTLPRDRATAWLEPALDTFMFLQRQVDAIVAQLPQPGPELQAFRDLLDRCIVISRRELAGESLAGEDVAFLNQLDTQLHDLIGREDGPIAVDVHTEPNSGQVLVEALAAPTIVESRTSTSAIARGALFTHIEFHHPLSNRLTDERWAEMVRAGVPAAAEASGRLVAGFAKRMAGYVRTKQR